MSQLGRIGGQVLTDNLLRAGVDLAFETTLLYLDVTNRKIGIRKSSPIYELDVNSSIKTLNHNVDTLASIGNLRISTNTISTSVGGIDVFINGGGEIFHDILTTSFLNLNGNKISSISNSNIVLDPNGSGTVELLATTNITGNLAVSGNITLNGNLTGLGTLTLGDQTVDTLTVNTDFTQSIIPGDDITYALGADAGDSSPRRWAEVHAPEWQYINNGTHAGSGIHPSTLTISSQTLLDGINNRIFAQQSNDDIVLDPDTGIVYIESTKWQDSDITNLLNTPLTFAATGIGYYDFVGNNAMVIPSGPTAEQRATPELGETRWNTSEQYLESFDGNVWSVSTGGGGEVTEEIMYDLGNVWTLTLG